MAHQLITLSQLLGPYANEPWTRAELVNGERTVASWNAFCLEAEADGVLLVNNPATGNAIGGHGNGGARPKGSTIGALNTKHKLLLAVDRFDPRRLLAAWAITPAGDECARRIGLWFEHLQWTRTWLHGQIVPPGSGARWFIPFSDLEKHSPTCAALPGQADAGIKVFEFA